MKRTPMIVPFLALSFGCYAQSAQPSATPDEVKYFTFVLMQVASLDHSPDGIRSFGVSFVQQFGLNADEATTVHSAGQTLNAFLQTLRRTQQSIMAGKATLSAADADALSALTTQRQELIASLANQILNSVRPATANLLRAQGGILSGLNAAQGVQ
jgi:uncharacterized protein (DUF885 family)